MNWVGKMTPPSPPDETALDHLLDELLELSPAARSERLAALARAEPDTAQRLQHILAAEQSERLEQAVGALAGDLIDAHAGLAPGTRLGAWRIERLLGEGGMGRVYLGERADGAFRMQVAIKVLRTELELPAEVLGHERNLLARLEHPALTRLLDGGVSSSGDVFLVMELVQGQSLPDWLHLARPALAARVALFQTLAEAVSHAHHQRVVHGDIKPGNIHVDAEDRPRLLDFGIAQIVDAIESGHATLVDAMTPGYAAPERLAGAPASVRTDVYAMGALLRYLLLEPGTGLAGMPRRRDLEAIVARAMATDPAARYGNISALADELARWQQAYPVQARRAGWFYPWSRFIGRHRLAVASAALALGALLAGSAILLWQNQVIRAERDQARSAEARSDTVLDYLVGVMGRIGRNGGNDLPLDQALAADLANIDRDFAGDRAARQNLLSRLAELHVRMQDHATAARLLDRIGPLDEDGTNLSTRVRTLDNRAQIALHAGELGTATALEHSALALLRAQPGDHRGQVSQLLVSRAQIESRAGQQAAAVATLREALRLRLEVSPPDAAQTVVVRNGLAVSLMRAGTYTQALDEFRALIQALQSSQREHSLDAANIYNNHAATAFVVGLYDEAGAQFAHALQLQEARFGPSAALAALLSNYGRLELSRGELARGAAMIARAVAMMRDYGQENGIDLLLVRVSQAIADASRGETDTALANLAEVEARLVALLGESHPLVERVRANALGIAADNSLVEPTDPGFEALDQALAGAGLQRERAELACQQSRLALVRQHPELAAARAAACLEAWHASQDPGSPRLAWAHFLVAEATWRLDPTEAHRQQRDARLERARAVLPGNLPPYDRLAALAQGA